MSILVWQLLNVIDIPRKINNIYRLLFVPTTISLESDSIVNVVISIKPRFIFHIQDEFTGMTLYSREPKKGQMKSVKLGAITNEELCPVLTTQCFLEKTEYLRGDLASGHTLFLSYINDPHKVNSVSPKTAANWVHDIMVAAKINPQYKPHSLRAGSSASAVMKGLPIFEVRRHANWSKTSNTFEQYYFKLFGKHATSTHTANITLTVFNEKGFNAIAHKYLLWSELYLFCIFRIIGLSIVSFR